MVIALKKKKRQTDQWNRTDPRNKPMPAAAAKSCQSCLTLYDPIDGSPPGSAVPGILQARTQEWAAISFFSAWKWEVKVKSLSRVPLFATPWTAAHQAPPSMGFARQEYWSWVPLPSPNWSLTDCKFLPPPPLLFPPSLYSYYPLFLLLLNYITLPVCI